MKAWFPNIIILLILIFHSTQAQIPENRLVDWSNAGNKAEINLNEYTIINVADHDFDNAAQVSNNSKFEQILSEYPDNKIIIQFGEGTYFFDNSIRLRSNVILKGSGSNDTKLLFDQNGSGHSIIASGSKLSDEYFLEESADIRTNQIFISEHDLNVGDWVKIFMDDEDLVTSDWAINSVGQILKVKSVESNSITFESDLSIDYPVERNPRIQRINPVENVRIECLSIERVDNTAPQQSSNIYFNYVVNSEIKSIESDFCTYGHVTISNSSNITVRGSYFANGFEYGGGGRAYGTVLQFSTTNCLIENNAFENLRHSILLQAGSNTNVIAYNYSTEAFWVSNLPSDAAGELTLHGNYIFSNLFEGNIVGNIVIDNSHGPNGNYNTFFRNRADLWGIFFSASNSPGQNIIANEIPNESFPYSLVNFTIQGNDHYVYGNYVKSGFEPDEPENIDRQTYFYQEKPSFLSESQFGKIGFPYHEENTSIPAQIRFENEILTADCSVLNVNDKTRNIRTIENGIIEYNNPQSIIIYDLNGKLVYSSSEKTNHNINHLNGGVYLLVVEGELTEIIIKN